MSNDFEPHHNGKSFRNKVSDTLRDLKDSRIKRLIHNFFSLSILQGANYILPLIILPYLIAVIGKDKFGLIVFAQAAIQYFIIVTDYGFNLSATRDIAANQKDISKISTLFSSVFLIKLTLSVAGFAVLFILGQIFDKFQSDFIVYLLTYGLVIGNLLFPIWFFQGMEKMKYTTILAVSAKVIYLILLIVFVRTENDYILVPLLNSAGVILAGFISIFIILRKFKVRFLIPQFSTLTDQFKRSSQFFLSRLSVSIYSSLNTLILGFFTSNEMVCYYAAAEKIFIAMRSAFNPLVQALYPFMANKPNISFFKKVFFIALGLGVIMSAGVFLFSDRIIDLIFNTDMDLSADILQVFALIIPVIVISILIGYPFLAALGHEKYANFSIAIGSIIHIILIALLIPVISPIRVAMAVMVTELVVLGVRIRGIKKHDLWKIK